MLGDGYLNANYLLNHPAFRQLVREGKFRIGRVSGKTKAWNIIDPETKTKVATSQSEGIPYSEFGDADFLTSLINLKLAGFDSRNNKLFKKDISLIARILLPPANPRMLFKYLFTISLLEKFLSGFVLPLV